MIWRVLVAVLLITTLVSERASAAPKRPRIEVPLLELNYVPPPLIAVPDGDDVITSLSLNQQAPYSGQLFDPSTSLRWAHYIQQAQLRLREDVLLERRTCNANLTYMGRRLELEREYGAVVESDLRGRVLKLEKYNQKLQEEINHPGFFSSPAFWFGGGVVVTGLMVTLGVIVASEAK